MIYPITIESAGGEYMDSVVIVEWTVKPGEKIKAGDTVVVVETAKAATEVPAPSDGYLVATFFEPGQEAPVGALLGNIGDTPDATGDAAPAAAPAAAAGVAKPEPAAAIAAPRKDGRIVASPLARRIAALRGVDLATVAGSGPNGRIKKRDVEAAKPGSAPIAALARPAIATGASAPVVLLHGFGADRTAWRLVKPLLDPALTVIMPELPGHGDVPLGNVSTIDDMALAIDEALDAQGISEAHLVGHSLGGATALALTHAGRTAVRSLCLIAPGGLGPEINFDFLSGVTNATQEASLKQWFDVMVADPSILPDSMAGAVLRQRERAGTQAAQQALLARLFPDGVQSMRLSKVLQAVDVPAKVIWGTDDRIVPASHASKVPGHVALHLLRETGHVPHMEQPQLVARLIGELVRSNP